ncbi:unnamed protein product [Menidia menidia]|uniref:(Atlantic silverside) hypothetical protein n=1 Tax=Menidia menidia TaxID=238744 RepID=A0A8S4B0Z5_9TELE|nr:unnamed protein product [Menidia menidia]
METVDFIQEKLTEWGLREFIHRFQEEGFDKETFLSLGDSANLKLLIPKLGPQVKFRNRLKEYLQIRTSSFVQGKLTEWGFSELILRFQEEGIDKEAFLNLEELGNINTLIPKIGPRVKFRKRLKEYLQTLKTNDDTPERIDTSSDQEENQEMDSSLFLWNLESTSRYDTDDGKAMSKEPIYPGGTVSRGKGLLAAMLFILHHQLPAAVQGSLMALLNFLIPGLIVETRHLFQAVHSVSTVFYCDQCQNYLGKNPTCCSDCKKTFDKASSFKNGNFFLYASLKDLLKDILNNYGTKLLPKVAKHDHDFTDVLDGLMYQNLLKQGTLGKDDLTLTWNCDGVPIFEPRFSVWPLQFMINELPYALRQENLIVAGLWFGPKNPKMDTFLKPFIDECCDLAQNPFQWNDSSGAAHSSKVFSLVCSSDAVARPLLRNCKQFNGEYGCDWCLHPGKVTRKGSGSVRSYPYDEVEQVKRSKIMFEDNGKEAEDNNLPENGVKGRSSLSGLPVFDIVLGFVPEYMHSVLLGVSRQLMSLWLDPKNSSKAWYVGQHIDQMDSCLLRQKPPAETIQRPHSLKNWNNWKASQWRAFLLFYAVSVLPGVLHPPFLTHYFFLSFGIHILLQESVSQCDLKLAHHYLVQFVVKMKELYGEENVSFNCHQLIHLAESVQNWGPLWVTSAFSFEKNSGKLRKLLTNINYNHRHIFQRFLFWRQIPSHLKSSVFSHSVKFGEVLTKLSGGSDEEESYSQLGHSESLEITGVVRLAIEELLHRPALVKSVEVFDSFTVGNTVYRKDCVIALKNGNYGEIQFVCMFKEKCLCTSGCLCRAVPITVVHMYSIKPDPLFTYINPSDASKMIFVRVEKTEHTKAFFLDDIRCNCMYLNGWLVPLPNSYERH